MSINVKIILKVNISYLLIKKSRLLIQKNLTKGGSQNYNKGLINNLSKLISKQSTILLKRNHPKEERDRINNKLWFYIARNKTMLERKRFMTDLTIKIRYIIRRMMSNWLNNLGIGSIYRNFNYQSNSQRLLIIRKWALGK
jgi:hypothetical protein